MKVISQIGFCSERKRSVGIQFVIEQDKYTAEGSYIPSATATEDGGGISVIGRFYVGKRFLCKCCKENRFIYQCSACKTYVCYDGKEHKNFVCPKCGKTSSVPQIPTDGRIVTSASGGKVDIVLAIDISGSMSGGRLEEVKRAAVKDFISKYDGKARMGLVTFESNVVVDLPPTDNIASVKKAVQRLQSKGGTFSPLPTVITDPALKGFLSSENKKYLVVFTDGEWCSGDHVGDAKKLFNMGVRIITIGCAGANGKFLSSISSPGASITVSDGNITAGFASAADMIGQ